MSSVVLWHSRIGWIMLVPALYMAITGIAAGLSDQIERIAEPQLFSVEPVPHKALSRAQIEHHVAALLGDVTFTILPRNAIFDTWQIHYGSEQQRVLWLNPHSAEVIADRPLASRPSTIIKALHSGEIFSWRGFSAFASAALLLLSVTGFISHKHHSRGRRYWHIRLAIIALPVVVLLALSGLVMSLFPHSPAWLYDLHSGKYAILRIILVASLIVFTFSLIMLIRFRTKR